MTQTIIVAIIVLVAIAWLVWHLVRQARGGGCGSCATAATCPFAAKGVCPSGSPEGQTDSDDTSPGS
jgi:hypothetical protein